MNAIVCIDTQNGIGMNDKLLYRIPADLKRFKSLTSRTNCNVVIMGRKTYESIGHPLPGRINIVMTTKQEKIPGVVIANNVNEVLKMVNDLTKCCIDHNIFVIGGSEIYSLFENYIKTIYVTKVFEHKNKKADTTFKIGTDFIMYECTSVFHYKKLKYRYEKYLKNYYIPY